MRINSRTLRIRSLIESWLSADERQTIEDILFETYNCITVHQTGEVLTDRPAFRRIEDQVDLFAIARQ